MTTYQQAWILASLFVGDLTGHWEGLDVKFWTKWTNDLVSTVQKLQVTQWSHYLATWLLHHHMWLLVTEYRVNVWLINDCDQIKNFVSFVLP